MSCSHIHRSPRSRGRGTLVYHGLGPFPGARPPRAALGRLCVIRQLRCSLNVALLWPHFFCFVLPPEHHPKTTPNPQHLVPSPLLDRRGSLHQRSASEANYEDISGDKIHLNVFCKPKRWSATGFQVFVFWWGAIGPEIADLRPLPGPTRPPGPGPRSICTDFSAR